MDRYLTRVYITPPGEKKTEVQSLVVYCDPGKGEGPLTAYNKAITHVVAQLTAEVVGMMGPDADDRMQDGVVQ